MRDPISRLWSHVKFHHKFVGEDKAYLSWSKDEYVKFLNLPYIRINCHYAKCIDSMQASLSSEEYNVVYFEDLIGSPNDSIRQIESFLGVEPFDYPEEDLTTAVNVTEKIPMPTNFLEAAKEILDNEINSLVKVGIAPHPAWSVEELL